MSIEKKYDNAFKLAPFNLENKAINVKPEVSFGQDEVSYTKEYFSKDVIKKKLVTINLLTKTKKSKNISEENVLEEEYHPGGTNLIYSLDKKYAIFSKDYNLYMKNVSTKVETKLTEDGNKNHFYASPVRFRAFNEYLKKNEDTIGLFNDDSSKVLVPLYSLENMHTLSIIKNFNKDSLKPFHPETYTYNDWFPFDDTLVKTEYVVLDLKTKKITILNSEISCQSYSPVYNCKWDDDSNGFIHVEFDKCYKTKYLYHTSLIDNTDVLLASEHIDTFFFDVSLHGPMSFEFGFAIHILKDNRIIWYSQKDDMGAFYFIDSNTKKIGKRITSLDYNVSNLLGIDEDNETIYFMASCMEKFSEPYYGSLCSIKFNGSDFKSYSNEDCQHQITLSPDFKYYTDTLSRVDKKPVTYLKSFDGSIDEVLIEANISKLLKDGYQMPKRFKVHSKDTGYDLYGIVVLPKNYNPNKKYPVVEYVYGGMQIVNAAKTFEHVGSIKGREPLGGLEGFQALGFIGVVIDGPGTPFRGKKFHDISYRHMGDCSGLFTHPEVIKELSKTYTGMDLTRVGIWGNSAGGYASTRALLFFPDFYKVAVSSAGDHDNSIYAAPWALRFNGPFDEEEYKFQDNARFVDKLKGHLLLVHGLLDDNVHPSQTFRMIEYLEKAGKNYDLVVLPDTDHNCPANVYFQKRRFDYFVQHLMNKKPPVDYKIKHEFFNYDELK